MSSDNAAFWWRALLLFGVVGGLCQGWLYWAGLDTFSLTGQVWSVGFVLLIALWVTADSRGRVQVYRPHDFGWLVLLFWPIYLPYYLVHTRGWRGIILLAGLLVLWQLGYLLAIALFLFESVLAVSRY